MYAYGILHQVIILMKYAVKVLSNTFFADVSNGSPKRHNAGEDENISDVSGRKLCYTSEFTVIHISCCGSVAITTDVCRIDSCFVNGFILKN